jgi:ubiquitin-protein ligase
MATEKKTISKESFQRLIKDVRYIIKNPLTDNGIYYSHDDSNMLKGYAMIIGPEGTPYFSGYYFFIFDFPTDYPYSPPTVTYMTNNGVTRFNPNLYKCGKVCVSILNTWTGDKWSSCQTINSVLLTLCSLLNEQPLLNEPGHTKLSRDFIPYQKTIEFMNINFSICELIDPRKNTIPEPFSMFYPFMKDKFLQNYDKIYNFVENKKERLSIEIVQIYAMSTNIDYNYLQTKLDKLKKYIDNQCNNTSNNSNDSSNDSSNVM